MHFIWQPLSYHVAITTLLDAPETTDVAQVRAILDTRLREFFSFAGQSS